MNSIDTTINRKSRLRSISYVAPSTALRVSAGVGYGILLYSFGK